MTPLLSPRRRDYAPSLPMTAQFDPKLARRALNTLMEQGGLVTMKDLRDRLGGPVRPDGPHKPLSRQRVEELVAMEGFPERAYPAPGNDRQGLLQLWVWAEVDAWIRRYRSRPGKPGPRPRGGPRLASESPQSKQTNTRKEQS